MRRSRKFKSVAKKTRNKCTSREKKSKNTNTNKNLNLKDRRDMEIVETRRNLNDDMEIGEKKNESS